MVDIEEEQQARSELQELLDEFSSIDVSSLGREAELGQALSLAGAIPHVERILQIYADLKLINLEPIPHGPLNRILGQARAFKQKIVELQEFSIEKFPQNSQGERDKLIAQIRDSYDNQWTTCSPVLAIGKQDSLDLGQIEHELQTTVQNVYKLLNTQETAGRDLLQELQEVRDKAKDAAKEAGVTQHAGIFGSQATAHKKTALKWVIATIILGLVAILGAVGTLAYYLFGSFPTDTGSSLRIATGTLVFFAILLTATLWAGKNYRSEIHNNVVNKHRQNALSTFETFASAADTGTKGAVLLQATTAIFAPQDTGFGTSHNDGGDGAVTPVGLLAAMAAGGKTD